LTEQSADTGRSGAAAGASRELCDVLMATDVRFWRGQLGSQRRIASILSWLHSTGRQPTVFFLGGPLLDDAKQLASAFPWLKVVFSADVARMTWRDRIRPQNVAGSLSEWVRRIAVQLKLREPSVELNSFFRPDCQRVFGALVNELQPKMVLVEYVRLSYLADARAPGRTVWVVDTHDVQSQRWEAFAGADRSQVLRVSAVRERSELAKFDRVLAIQHRDLSVFEGQMRLPAVSLALHAEAIHEHGPWGPTGQVLVVGSNIVPNVDAVLRLLGDWPKVYAASGGRVRLSVLGSLAEALRGGRLPPGVDLVGFVPDLSPWYAGAELVLNPVAFGSGLKIKSVEALCHGRPLLTTPVGAEGLPHQMELTAFAVAEAGDAFIEALVVLLREPDRMRSMALAATEYARLHFLADRAYASLAEVFEDRSMGATNVAPVLSRGRRA